ncbi:GNAT family N-acetyltransferase [Lactococcus lactis]|uniref:N-acetyltransferase n=1 Tax=Lactococcus lactis TaxID=1358 RepID=A0AAP8DZA0_9LACT|nr:GNAT family N-acetyltransferase [Lactococcus lactis]KST93808.1 DNA-3-methyladenine glycosylase [Lactococcus lactis subsp. lactis]KSU09681.1 DNA-3-methyladenine glycosylase [Lactococcus lactis subsp. lactis]MDG4972488.1 GNAT family N-acetyltransferase [Lactococcus lactis]PFG87303.1 N-acetyltransferase [Lactococcus lactis]
MTIKRIELADKKRIIKFFYQQWQEEIMVVSSGSYHCSELDGFIYEKDFLILGLITYTINNNILEIISLDSIVENQGIGSLLLKTVEEEAKMMGVHKIKIITTNDNLLALKFYQKKGYRITKVVPDAVKKARKIKKTIPLKGNDNIPIWDELVLSKQVIDTKC